MALMMTSNQEKNSRLNQRISADLRQKVQLSDQSDPNFVEDANYLKDTKKTGKFTWVWVVLGFIRFRPVLASALSVI